MAVSIGFLLACFNLCLYVNKALLIGLSEELVNYFNKYIESISTNDSLIRCKQTNNQTYEHIESL